MRREDSRMITFHATIKQRRNKCQTSVPRVKDYYYLIAAIYFSLKNLQTNLLLTNNFYDELCIDELRNKTQNMDVLRVNVQLSNCTGCHSELTRKETKTLANEDEIEKHASFYITVHRNIPPPETNCQRATRSNPTCDSCSPKSLPACPACQAPPEAPFDTCLPFYKNCRSPSKNRCTASPPEQSFSKRRRTSSRPCSIFSWPGRNSHASNDSQRTARGLVSRRCPRFSKQSRVSRSRHSVSSSRSSFRPRCFHTTAPPRSTTAPRRRWSSSLWPVAERSAQTTSLLLRTRPSSVVATRCSSSSRRSSFSPTKCP